MQLRWILAYTYNVYLFLATLPQLTNLPPFGGGLPILVLILLYLYHSFVELGVRAARFLLTSTAIGFVFELVGVHTGFPFGEYYYTGTDLGPMVLGVPAFIPLLWATLSYFSYSSVENPFLGAWLMVLADITIDPLFSRFDWHWVSPGQYFGVPLTNFLGWFLVSTLILITWDARWKNRVRLEPTLFYAFFLFDLALQDYFAGLVLPAVASWVLTAVTTMVYAFRSIKTRSE
ncbi:MAG: carotenoid biosynthesis protein [Thermoprotei archaeon]